MDDDDAMGDEDGMNTKRKRPGEVGGWGGAWRDVPEAVVRAVEMLAR